MDTKTAKGHVTLVAGLHIGYGSLKLLAALIIYLGVKFAWGFIPDEEDTAREVLQLVFSILPSVVAFFGIVEVLAGISVLSYKSWSRVFTIIISALNCLNIPIGTAIGVYSIWTLMKPEVLELFDQ